jgi:hypothetical protein
VIVFRIALLAPLVRLGFRLDHIRLHEQWWRRLLFPQLLDARLGHSQLLVRQLQLLILQAQLFQDVSQLLF